ncbi:MAG TPA: hypothetical protein VF062_24470 [Candidatus Limnocylindrales bacterium]
MRRALAAFSLIFTTTLAGIVVTPGVAFAGQNAIVDSTNGGSQAHFHHDGEHLYACDTSANGVRAVAIASWIGTDGVWRTAEVQDADGANGNCGGHGNLSITDGIYVNIYACERNGATGALRNCGVKTAQA